jgi:hypothetical protein
MALLSSTTSAAPGKKKPMRPKPPNPKKGGRG